MKKLLLCALLLCLSMPSMAQWVTIPDPAFVTKLTVLFPGCMNGDQLDAQCSDVVNATLLDVSYSGLSDLSGVEHFVGLQLLFCNNNTLSVLPTLPGSLTELRCGYNDLTELPGLPGSLATLWCHNNAITELPPLPGSLTSLHCFNNNLSMLPELPGSLTELLCVNNDLAELPVLPVGLLNLACANNSLDALPELPGSLINLNCANNNIAALPTLPSSLTNFSCHNNVLTELPELPGLLTHLYCYSNNLSMIPELPGSLTHLLCASNGLTELPELPGSLTNLSCSNNSIATLPVLPASLTNLSCGFNSIAVLPALPGSLTHLECQWNNLDALPELPGSLERLYCFNNNLVSLPALPGAVQSLYCQFNELTSLPELPGSLTRLTCQNNQLACLPELPMSLTNNSTAAFSLSNNPFTCLPNYVPAMSGPNAQWLTYPLCDLADLTTNPYGCSSFEGIVGAAFDDVDQNCLLEAPEPGLPNLPIKLLDDQGNQLAMTNSLVNGVYNFVTGEGEYTVQLVTEDIPYQVSCAVPGDLQDVELTTADPAALDVDFGVECLPGFDIGVQSVVRTGWIFPGQEHTLRISAGDMSAWYGLQCATGVSGTVTVVVDGPVSYVGPAPGALTPTVTGSLQFTYTIADFALVNFTQDFRLRFATDTTAQGGDEVCVNVLVEPLAGDNNPGNNTYNYCYPVVNSYDPNIKQVWPENVGPGYDGYFTYTIWFQNTGSAPAFNIRLADTLDTNLDLGTFAVSSYSHPVLTYLSGNLLTFRFNNIMLPDSTSDPEGSIGFVQYRIKPLTGLPVGTVIENTAHIYFDFNDAIVTNTTQNMFTTTTGVAEVSMLGVQVFPNPGSGQYQVVLNTSSSGPTHMEVYDLAGMRVAEQRVEGALAVLDLSGQAAGLYLLRVLDERGSEVVRLVKH